MTLSPSSTQANKNAHYRAVLIAYARAMSERDAEAIVALWAEDGALVDPVGSSGRFTGISELRPFYTRVCRRDIAMRVEGHIACSKSNVACAPMRVDVEGSVIHAVSVVQFDDAGLITRYDAYWGPGDVEGPDPSTGSDYGILTPYDDHWEAGEGARAGGNSH